MRKRGYQFPNVETVQQSYEACSILLVWCESKPVGKMFKQKAAFWKSKLHLRRISLELTKIEVREVCRSPYIFGFAFVFLWDFWYAVWPITSRCRGLGTGAVSCVHSNPFSTSIWEGHRSRGKWVDFQRKQYWKEFAHRMQPLESYGEYSGYTKKRRKGKLGRRHKKNNLWFWRVCNVRRQGGKWGSCCIWRISGRRQDK